MKHVSMRSIPLRKSVRNDELVACVHAYKESLEQREQVYRKVQEDFPQHILCSPSCNECCFHVFMIRILDLFLVRERWLTLSRREQRRYTRSALKWSRAYQQKQVGLFIGSMHDVESVRQMESKLPLDGIACPFLRKGEGCSIYPDRPMLCRAHGYPELTLYGEMESTCYKNLLGIPSAALESYSLPVKRYIEISDLRKRLLSVLGIEDWEGAILSTGLVVPIVLDPAEIDWPRLTQERA